VVAIFSSAIVVIEAVSLRITTISPLRVRANRHSAWDGFLMQR
jgi:hypothetical protein